MTGRTAIEWVTWYTAVAVTPTAAVLVVLGLYAEIWLTVSAGLGAVVAGTLRLTLGVHADGWAREREREREGGDRG